MRNSCLGSEFHKIVSLLVVAATGYRLWVTIVVTEMLSLLLCQSWGGCSSSLSSMLDMLLNYILQHRHRGCCLFVEGSRSESLKFLSELSCPTLPIILGDNTTRDCSEACNSTQSASPRAITSLRVSHSYYHPNCTLGHAINQSCNKFYLAIMELIHVILYVGPNVSKTVTNVIFVYPPTDI